MKRSLWIFLVAILLPSIGLGWLALRSAGEQQIILERRTAELYQKETDAVASAARALIDDERRAFAEAVRRLLAEESPAAAGAGFRRQNSRAPGRGTRSDSRSTRTAISSRLLPQEARDDAERQRFLLNNRAFLSGATAATVYSVPADELNRPGTIPAQSEERISG